MRIGRSWVPFIRDDIDSYLPSPESMYIYLTLEERIRLIMPSSNLSPLSATLPDEGDDE
jgi:hypothetical protein